MNQSCPLFHVVLFQPEIPENTGAIGRTCVGVNAKLWLVRPLGFQVDQRRLKRAGLDYWPNLNWEIVDDWNHLLEALTAELSPRDAAMQRDAVAPREAAAPRNAVTLEETAVPRDAVAPREAVAPRDATETLSRQADSPPPCASAGRMEPESSGETAWNRPLPGRFWFLTKRGVADYTQAPLQAGDVFVFGAESTGLPAELLAAHADRRLKIPIQPGIRSLNLSVSVGITLFEARRQVFSRPFGE